jgi:ABC-type amino acid transport system permease subunit
MVIRGNTGSNWDVFAVLALLYFVVCASVGAIGRAAEKRLDRGYFVLDRQMLALESLAPAVT